MDLSLDLLAQLAWTGFASSSSYCLFALAFALVLKVNRIWNFGQAGLMIVAYFSMYVAFPHFGLPPLAGAAIGVATTIAASIALERWGFGVLRKRNSSVLTFFIFTISFAQCLIYTGELVFGTDPKTLFPSIVSPVNFVGPIVVSQWDLIALSTAFLTVASLWIFLRHTREGKSLMAVWDEPDLAEMYGISKDRAYAVAMAAAAVLLTAGMYLMGTKSAMYPATPMKSVPNPGRYRDDHGGHRQCIRRRHCRGCVGAAANLQHSCARIEVASTAALHSHFCCDRCLSTGSGREI